MPHTGNFPHKVVDPLAPPTGAGGNAHEFHTTGFGKKAGPEQVIFAGEDSDPFRPGSCFFFDELSMSGMLGNVLAVISGLTYAGVFFIKKLPGGCFESASIISLFACFVVGLPSLIPDLASLVAGTGAACVLPTGPLAGLSCSPITVMVLMGVVQMGLSYVFLSLGLDESVLEKSILLTGLCFLPSACGEETESCEGTQAITRGIEVVNTSYGYATDIIIYGMLPSNLIEANNYFKKITLVDVTSLPFRF